MGDRTQGRPPAHSLGLDTRVETEECLPSVVAQFQDVTSREQTEEALRSSELKFRQMTEMIGEVFWMASADAKTIHYINPAFEKIWGRPCAELYANPDLWLEAIHPEDIAKVRSALDGFSQGRPYDIDYRISALTAPWHGSTTVATLSAMNAAGSSSDPVLPPTSRDASEPSRPCATVKRSIGP